VVRVCAGVVAIAATASCSVVALHGRKARLAEAGTEPYCAGWFFAPGLDLAVAGYVAALGVLGLSLGEDSSAVTPAFVTSGVFIASMFYGTWETARCYDHAVSRRRPPTPGALELASARATVARHSQQFAVCGPSPSSVRTAIAVSAEGRVVRASVYQPVEAALERRVTAVVTTIQFPASSSGLTFLHDLAW
jgi:hypothetical protein